mmetsp:Transcript_16311/g.37276  ORF Transcript_16311/g.37276 Transcript_16311/m.37276 type:complete len:126 (+) Transcript_16311:200-577(+)
MHLASLSCSVRVSPLTQACSSFAQSGWTPLMLAIQHSLYDMVEYLVDEAGAPLDAITNNGWNMHEFIHQHDIDGDIIKFVLRKSSVSTAHVDAATYREAMGIPKDIKILNGDGAECKESWQSSAW